LQRAFRYAAEKHDGQTRKQTAVPYLSHLMAVASLVLEAGGDEDMAIAALLHDVVEDCAARQGVEPQGAVTRALQFRYISEIVQGEGIVGIQKVGLIEEFGRLIDMVFVDGCHAFAIQLLHGCCGRPLGHCDPQIPGLSVLQKESADHRRG
jgi:hypothetical protein